MAFSIPYLSLIFQKRKNDNTFCKIGINLIGEIETPKGEVEEVGVTYNPATKIFECNSYKRKENGELESKGTLWL
jgi:hypothetical protein